jgi:hypothetical protein
LTGVVALASTLDVVFGFGKKENQHDQLCRRFTELAAMIAELTPTPENLRWARAERLRIEADEPTERRLVDLQAENEECRARGVDEEDHYPFTSFQRWFGYVATFGIWRIKAWHKARWAEVRAEADEKAKLEVTAGVPAE